MNIRTFFGLGLCLAGLSVGAGFFSSSPDDILQDVRASVKNNWRKVAERSAEIGELREEMKSLPNRGFWFFTKDKRDQEVKIRQQLLEVRKLLLSTTAREILEKVDALDASIADLNREIAETTELRTLDPDKAKDCNAKIEKLTKRRTALEGRRKVEAKKVYDELRALGLTVSGASAENCLFTVNFGELIDGVVVAQNVAAVVDNLRQLMTTDDIAAARRYYGMYLVLVDVQILCFKDYLAKSRTGEWRQGINRIKSDAQKARESALQNARDDTFTADQHKIFRHNAEINASTLKAVDAYIKVLDAHEDIIEQKLGIAEKIRKVVASSSETINLAGDFVRLAKANQEAFNALIKLELPPIQMFDDTMVQQEFESITKKLKD